MRKTVRVGFCGVLILAIWIIVFSGLVRDGWLMYSWAGLVSAMFLAMILAELGLIDERRKKKSDN